MEIQAKKSSSILGITFKSILAVGGLIIVAPYLFRRLKPLLDQWTSASADDVAVAGKDAVRDVADDMGVGGVSGTLNRAVGRVSDHLTAH